MKIRRFPARLTWLPSLVLGASGLYSVLSSSSIALAKQTAAVKPQLIEKYGKIPLSFEQNQGQADAAVKFLSRGQGYSLFLLSDKAVLTLKPAKANPLNIGLRLVGAISPTNLHGLDELPGKSNYFLGSDPAKWQTNVRAYSKVEYKNVYDGIDLVYYGNQRQLEYDFVVQPGADPRNIGFEIQSSTLQGRRKQDLRIDTAGDLLLATAAGPIHFHKPIVYQTGTDSQPASRRLVDGRYVITRDKRVHFKIAAYDKTQPLIIDPVLTYSTYLGNGSEIGMDVAVDSSGNAYIAGTTNSASFPTTAGAYQPVLRGGCVNSICSDAFVAKLDPSGSTLLYSTFLGGSGGDYASSIAVDSAGNAYITGATNSTDFPLSNPPQPSYGGGPSDAFIAKLAPNAGSLIYSGYLGGAGQDQGTALAVDSSGSAYVVGSTSSANFAAATAIGACGAGNLTHAFVSKLNTAGNGFAYKTCLGGNGTDQASAVAINSSGYAYVVGSTSSTNFPTTARAYQRTLKGSHDAFVAVLNSTASAFYYSSYYGGSNSDSAAGVALDSAKRVYITGTTYSSDFPVSPAAFQSTYGGSGDAFVAKLDLTVWGTAGLLYSTYVGGTGADTTLGIALDTGTNAYVTGITGSANFPLASPVQNFYGGGATDRFLFELNPAGTALLYSSYLGGSGAEDSAGWGNVAVDSLGNTFVVGVTNSGDFPTISATALQPNKAGITDAFISKIGALSTPLPALTLAWPLPTLDNRSITQENYSEYNFSGNHMFHTGLSLLAPAGTFVGAGAAGNVVKIYLNPPKGSVCTENGYGNTVFIQHSLADGSAIYTQYSHMRSIDPTLQQQCGTPNSQYQITCSSPIPVSALQSLGTVGHTACGYDDSNPSDTHLHLELKNFLGLLSPQGPGKAGYTTTPPDEYGLYNPIFNLHPVTNLTTAMPVVVTGNSPINMLTGPGGSGSSAYRYINQLAAGTQLEVIRMLRAATTTPPCSSGWYEVERLNGAFFTDTMNSTGQMQTGWVCADSVSSLASSPPTLSVTPASMTFNATAGGADPASLLANVNNLGGGTLTFSASSDSAWLAVAPTNGTAPQTIQVSATIGNLVAGTYTGHITVDAGGVQGSPATITVTLNVAVPPPPTLSASPISLSFSGTQGSSSDPSPAFVSVTNTGSGTLNFNASSDSAWLSVMPASGAAPQNLQISASVGALTAGTYTGHVTVTASGAQGSPATVTVTFTVAPPPPPTTLAVSTNSLTFNGTQGSSSNPPPANVNVTNTGSGTLSFSAGSDSAWLTVSPTSGTAPQTLQISAIVGNLTAGTYVGNVTVTAAGAQGSPATISVTFTVAPSAPPAPPGGFFIRGNTKSQTTASTTIVQGWSGRPQQGDLMVAYIWWNSSTVAISSVTDSCSNTWVSTTAQIDSGSNSQAQLFYVAGHKSCGSVPTVTATFASAVLSRLVLGDWSGVGAGSSYYDVSATSFQSSTTVPSSAATTTNAKDLIVQVAVGNNSADKFVSGSGFTNRQSASGMVLADTIVAAAQNYSTDLTSNAADNIFSGIFAFKLTNAAAFSLQSNLSGVTGTAVSCGYPQPVKAGDLLVAYVSWLTDSSVTMSLSDNINGAWLPAGGQAVETAGPHSAQMFYMPASAAGNLTVTAVPSNGASQALYINCAEVAGTASNSLLDGAAITSTNSSVTTLNVGPINTTNANDILVLGCATNTGNGFNPDTGFIDLQQQNHQILETEVVNAAGSYTQACRGGGAHYTGSLAAFRLN